MNHQMPRTPLSPETLWQLNQRLTPTELDRFWNALHERKGNSLVELISHAVENRKKQETVVSSLAAVPSPEALLTCWDLEAMTGKTGMPFWPLAMSYRGNEQLLKLPRVAIVGSRHPTYYGREQAFRFSRALAQNGVAVLSGGAIGIDAIANSTALEHGVSIAVLGSGLAELYPPANITLFREMSASHRGLLLSEFHPQQKAEKWNFPRRNRTIAALADFVLVVEAADRSGTMSTVRAALDCNIDVGAIPGPIDIPTSQGTNRLIAEGCFCIQSPEDLLQRLSTILVRTSEQPPAALQKWHPAQNGAKRGTTRSSITPSPEQEPHEPRLTLVQPPRDTAAPRAP